MNAQTVILAMVWAVLIVVIILNSVSYFRETRRLNKLKTRCSSKGLSHNQLENHKHNLTKNFNQTLSLLLTSVLILSTVIYSSTSLKLQERSIQSQIDLTKEQLNYLKRISSNNWAYLEVDFRYPPEKGYFEVSGRDLLNANNPVSFGLVAINSGKVDSGMIRIESYKNSEHLFARLNPSSSNISSQSGKYLELLLKQSSCQKDGTYCDPDILPQGMYNLTLEFRCDFCVPEQRTFEKIIPLCIWKETGTECEMEQIQ